MYANGQRTHLGTFQDGVDIFVCQFEILARRHLELNQADVIMAGDNARARAGCQHAFNAGGTLIRRVATA